MAFEIILVATAFFWWRIPTIVSGRFERNFPDIRIRRNRSTGTGVSLLASQIGVMVPAPSS
jgi:hypothetical protein